MGKIKRDKGGESYLEEKEKGTKKKKKCSHGPNKMYVSLPPGALEIRLFSYYRRPVWPTLLDSDAVNLR